MIAAGARPVGLGSLRLRVETAAISALAAVSALAEEKGA
jgi:16S rRNA (uracil1498-N3)-methyltransferase